jgi:hypothetical protein
MTEIKDLVPWLHENKILLNVVYIRSETNLTDFPSRQRGLDMCGPCGSPHNKSFCTWSSRHWARRSVHFYLRDVISRTAGILILILTKISASLVVTPEKHRSFLFTRLDLLNRTDPGETVRNTDYSMNSTLLTSSPGSVLFSRSNLLKKKTYIGFILAFASSIHNNKL